MLENDENIDQEETEPKEEKQEETPRKFADKFKTVEELETAYLAEQELIGRQGQELGEYRARFEEQPPRQETPAEPEFATDVERILWEKSQKLEQTIVALHQSSAQREIEDGWEWLERKHGAELDDTAKNGIVEIASKLTGVSTRQAMDFGYKAYMYGSTEQLKKGNPSARMAAVNNLGVNTPAGSDGETSSPTVKPDDKDMLAQLGLRDSGSLKRIAERAARRAEE